MMVPITVIAAPLGSIIAFVLLQKNGMKLTRKHYYVLWGLGLSFFIMAAILTGIVLPTGMFGEVIEISKLTYESFGLFGLILKVIIVSSLMLPVLLWWRERSNYGDFCILGYFYMGFADFLTDFLWLVLFMVFVF